MAKAKDEKPAANYLVLWLWTMFQRGKEFATTFYDFYLSGSHFQKWGSFELWTTFFTLHYLSYLTHTNSVIIRKFKSCTSHWATIYSRMPCAREDGPWSCFPVLSLLQMQPVARLSFSHSTKFMQNKDLRGTSIIKLSIVPPHPFSWKIRSSLLPYSAFNWMLQ